ncbi:MAG: acetylxylan esterase, partial [Pirellulaceae bacterium]
MVDGCVEGHCDCMFMVNLYLWDYEQVAALVAPRPLLILNTDKDSIFPLSGVVRLHAGVRRIYDFYDAPEKLGLVITEGPHKDTQELQLPVMRWFNRWLKRDETPVANYAEKLFEPGELKVLAEIPADEITSRCYENFTALADDQAELQPAAAIAALREKTFGAWPDAVPADGRSVPAASLVAE